MKFFDFLKKKPPKTEDWRPKVINKESVRTVTPLSFDDIQFIIDMIMDDNATVVSFSRVSVEGQQRFLDFLSGASYAADARITQVGPREFLIVPKGFEVK